MYGNRKLIQVERIGGAVVLTPWGNLHDRDAPRIEGELRALADDPAVRRVVVDLGRTGAIGAATLRMLDRLGQAARKRGGRLALFNLRGHERDALEVAAAGGPWPVFFSLPDAVEAVA